MYPAICCQMLHTGKFTRARRKCCAFRCAQECSILKSLNYDKNIVQFFGAVLRPGVEPMLVLEFMEV